MTRVVQFSHTGPAEVLEVVEVPMPVPGPGEVLVAVRAVGVNPVDCKIRSGVRPLPSAHAPYRLGSDGAGVVAALADGVTTLAVGDRVAVAAASGTYASDLVTPAATLTVLPDAVTFEQGAAVGVPVGTAYQSLISLGVTAGTTLLVHAGSGAVGQAAIQLARAWGADVIATAGAANQDLLRRLGATPVVYGPGLTERLRQVAPGGVDRVLDVAGTDEALQASLEVVDDPWHVATLVQGARAAELGIQAYLGGSPHPLTPQQRRLRAEAVPAVLELVAAGRFLIEIGSRHPLEGAAEAHRESEAGHPGGKIVLLP